MTAARVVGIIAVIAGGYAAWQSLDTARRLDRMDLGLVLVRMPMEIVARSTATQNEFMDRLTAELEHDRKALTLARQHLDARLAALDLLEARLNAIAAPSPALPR